MGAQKMRANDQVTTDYILEVETDNDHLRVDIVVLELANEELQEKYDSLRIEYERMISDRNYCP